MTHFIGTLVGLGLFWAFCGLWLRWRYISETWPTDLGWRRLEDLKEHDPGRLWTVYRIHHKRGRMTLIGLRKPL